MTIFWKSHLVQYVTYNNKKNLPAKNHEGVKTTAKDHRTK